MINNCVSGEDSLSSRELVARSMCSQVREVVGVGSLYSYVGEVAVHVVFFSLGPGVLIEGFEVVCFCVYWARPVCGTSVKVSSG